MRHQSLPQTLTVENLAMWIGQNKLDMTSIVEEIPFTEDEIAEFEHKSSKASREIDRLESVQKRFTNFLKKGTEAIIDRDGDGGVLGYEDQEIVIPGTVGLDTLKENRRYADMQIELGKRINTTELYFIPWPEKGLIVAVDVTGTEYPEHGRQMTDIEKETIAPLLMEIAPKVKKAKKEKKEKEKDTDDSALLDTL